MSLAGTRLGPYEIVSLLGAGGMGEVYRARDTALGRDVAIKVLPASFAADADRLGRFEREARLLASLNHPNIAAIYGVDDTGGRRALILELVEGDTLADRIGARGQGLGTGDALAIAKQIVDALDAAHERGIIHRDLKPANIKITPDGLVKVLDFGLAKGPGGAVGSGGPEGSDLTHSPTMIGPTAGGMLLGTAPYMSPEQARGTAIDRRTDIWAFGCVLHEMLTGRRAFPGETTTDTLAAILEREPDWRALPATTPATIRRLLQRCLAKDPRLRLRDIADARSDMDDSASATPAAVRASASLLRRHGAAALALGAGAVITAAILGAALLARRDRMQVKTGPEFLRVARFTSGPAREVGAVMSPDGKWVAYLSDAGGSTNVWVKFVGGGDAVNLTASSGLQIGSGTGISGLDVAPDGRRLAVAARPRGTPAGFATWEIPAPLPGVPRKLLPDSSLGARWSPDGSHLAFITAGSAAGDALFVADADGSSPRKIIGEHDGMHIHWPAWSSDGFIYFLRTFTTVVNLDAADIYRVNPRGGSEMEPVVKTVRRALFPLPMPNGQGLVYSANPNTAELRLWWSPLDGSPPRQLTTGVGEYAEPRASADGAAIVCTLYELRQSLVRIPVGASPPDPTPVTDGYQGDLDPALSPAGDRIVFSSSRDGNRHLWMASHDGSGARPLTSGSAYDDRPAFSTDGQQIAFLSDRGGVHAIWVLPSEGGPPRKIVDAETTGGVTWSRDGTRIVYSASIGVGPGLWSVPSSGGTPSRIPTPLFASEPTWSPTRDVIAYMSVSRGSGPARTSVAFVDPSGKPLFEGLPAPPGGNGFANGMVAWAPDGRRLAVTDQQANSAARIWIVDPASAHPYTSLIEFPEGPRVRGIAWTHDGAALIVGKHDWTSDIVLMDQPPDRRR